MLVPIVPRIRGIKEAAAELKKLDPDTALTEYRIRRLVNSGEIPCRIVGGKKLINFDELCEYLAYGKEMTRTDEVPENSIRQLGKIRRVSGR